MLIVSPTGLCNILRRRGSSRLHTLHAVSPCDEETACLKVHFERGNAQVFSARRSIIDWANRYTRIRAPFYPGRHRGYILSASCLAEDDPWSKGS